MLPESGTANAATTMVQCRQCGKDIPEINAELHEIRCRRNNNRVDTRPAAASSTANAQEELREVEDEEWQIVQRQKRERTAEERTPANDYPTSRRRRIERNVEIKNNNQREQQQQQQQQSTANNDDQWTCPRCTLRNPSSTSRCDACQYSSRQGSAVANETRSPDATRRERLVDPLPPLPPTSPSRNSNNNNRRNRNGGGGSSSSNNSSSDNNNNNNNNSSSSRFRPQRILHGAVNGAFLGSLFGGLGGLIGGAIAGAFCGALEDQIIQEQVRDDSGSFRGGQTIITRSGPRGRIIMHRTSPNSMTQDERIIQEFLYRDLMAQNGGANYAENVSYEELLRRFGTGAENRGASQQVIDSLPTEIVHNENKEPVEEADKNGEAGLCE